VEIEGHAHSVKKQRSHDVRRRQLAEGAGWRVLSVLPEQVRDGTAVALVRAALQHAPPLALRAERAQGEG
jgi:very-short-patch-repair endonuclease